MKPLPAGLPPATSRKWHNRRIWDSLGYLRVRSLANPEWPRDIQRLIDRLKREAQRADSVDRLLYEQAINAARRYTSAPPDTIDEAWDQVLTPIDEILTRRQNHHLAEVRHAQARQPERPADQAG